MLHGIFKDIKTIRVDADSTRHKGSLEKLLAEFRAGKADVLIGTQMVAKGLHFPQVTLVGVLNSDASLNLPDFRASESVFQLITQVAGRAGRGHTPGEVIIQTALPEHATIQQAAEQNFLAFYSDEIGVRKAFGFPPFSKIVKFLFTSKNEAELLRFAEDFRKSLSAELPSDFCSHPVAAAGHAKIKDLYRYQYFIRGPAVGPVVQALETIDRTLIAPASVSRYVDVDPTSLF
jgi:primosomal protein N' (replication factor Y)